MIQKVLVDNDRRFMKVMWDGENFTLVQVTRVSPRARSLIILSPKEMAQLQKFAIDEGDYPC